MTILDSLDFFVLVSFVVAKAVKSHFLSRHH